jgi:hypothetical protein
VRQQGYTYTPASLNLSVLAALGSLSLQTAQSVAARARNGWRLCREQERRCRAYTGSGSIDCVALAILCCSTSSGSTLTVEGGLGCYTTTALHGHVPYGLMLKACSKW